MEVQVLLTAPDGTMRYLFRFLFEFLSGVLDFIVVEMKPAGCLLPGCRQPSPRPVFGIEGQICPEHIRPACDIQYVFLDTQTRVI